MSTSQAAIHFIVPGTDEFASAASRSAAGPAAAPVPTSDHGTVEQAVRVSSRRDGGGATVKLTATPGQDFVEIAIANGPILVLHPEAARELLLAQQGGAPVQWRDGSAPPADEVNVPVQLAWRGLEGDAASGAQTRGGLLQAVGGVVLDTVRIVRRVIAGEGAEVTAEAVGALVDGQVDPGVYALSREALLPLKGNVRKIEGFIDAPSTAPSLVLIHGTFSSTEGTFSGLWKHVDLMQKLFAKYGRRVYALDHPTLAASPFTNALALLEQVPDGAELHLLTHSRGGLVAEVVARVLSGQGLDAASLALFDKPQYAQHQQDLAALAAHARRGIRVTRMMRVACPARGTLLASRRLDAYLSVFRWSLELAGLKVAPQLVQFLGAVAEQRLEPDRLPGLEAMVPDSPTTQWLMRPATPLEGALFVIAGDIRGDSVVSWLKTLLTDAFYWTDHDLVVQTRSMYGGTPRAEGGACFVFDQGGDVSHFRYFQNDDTATAVVNGLCDDTRPKAFEPIGPLSWAGEDSGGTRAAKPQADPSKPAVFVLPGILGSNLMADKKRIWLGWRFINGLEALKYPGMVPVSADGPVGLTYDKLMAHLARTHDVQEFSYDWRRPIEEEADRLANEVLKAIDARKGSGTPVRLLAHSMGGLVARTMALVRPDAWDAMFRHQSARLLMLGTPNGGSYAPMQVLSGDDTFGNLLSMFGSLFDGHKARQLIADMPGLLQLQADLLDDQLQLGTPDGWQKLQDADLQAVEARKAQGSWWHRDPLQQKALLWGLPNGETLAKAVALRRKLDAQRDTLTHVGQVLLVIGRAKATPTGVRRTQDGVEYLDAIDGGDGRVTHARAMLPRVKTWHAPGDHGKLPDLEDCFDAYVELLEKGTTDRLDAVGAGTRGAGDAAPVTTIVATRASRGGRGGQPPQTEEAVFRVGVEPPAFTAVGLPGRLAVQVVNGDLRLLGGPLLIGHYRAYELTGAEWVADHLLGGEMSTALATGAYPSAIGAAQIFTNIQRNPDQPFRLPRPSAVVVVGLGEEGELGLATLSDTVRQGVLVYAQRVAEQPGAGTGFDLSAVLIGSGGSNMQVATSAQAIALGVQEANQRLAAVGWPQVRTLQLVDRYLDRAAEALQALRSLSETLAQDLVVAPGIRPSAGALRRPPEAGYRGTDYDFIAVSQDGKNAPLRFTLDTRRARSEVRGVRTQSGLVAELVRHGACSGGRDGQTGRSLFQLMVPMEIEPFLAESTKVVLQLDNYSAQYPWELLDTAPLGDRQAVDGRPWALRSRLLRKLRTENYREGPKHAGRDGGVLVIGEPLCNDRIYGPLPAARREAAEVVAAFTAARGLHGHLFGVTALPPQSNAVDVTNAAFGASYRVIHVAGHGDFRKEMRDGEQVDIGGIVLSDNRLFGPDEVKAMRRVPDLVFINCCHIGRITREAFSGEAPRFAASVAEALIDLGVRCVVAAGWAVDDGPAAVFARKFYDELLAGQPFAEAVTRARECIWRDYPQSNTWAAYQCYGDPAWCLVDGQNTPDRQGAPRVASAEGLMLRLESFVQDLQQAEDDEDKKRVLSSVQQLDAAYGDDWGHLGEVCAAFGAAYGEAFRVDDALDRAIGWYERARLAEDGGGNVKAVQQLGNLLARTGQQAKIARAIQLLEHAFELTQSVEGACLLGSAHKRRAALEEKAHKAAAAQTGVPASQAKAVKDALRVARKHYQAGVDIARDRKADNLFYPLLNRIAIDARLGQRVSPKDVADAEASLNAKIELDPDFWAVIGQVELAIYVAAAARKLAPRLQGLKADIADLRRRASSSRQWDSVGWQADFVLGPYQKIAGLSQDELGAAVKLLEALRGEE